MRFTMLQSVPTVLFSILPLLGFAPALGAEGGGGATVDVNSIEIAGVRLGMTPDEASAALAKFDETLKITTIYLSSAGDIGTDPDKDPFGWRTGGRPDHVRIPTDSPIYSVDKLTAIKQDVNTGDDGVIVVFSPFPKDEKVIYIERDRNYLGDSKPSFDNVKGALIGKYPGDYTFKNEEIANQSASLNFGMLYDVKGRFINNSAAKSKRLLSGRDRDFIPPYQLNWGAGASVQDYREFYCLLNSRGSGGGAAPVERFQLILVDTLAMANRKKDAKGLDDAKQKIINDLAGKNSGNTKL